MYDGVKVKTATIVPGGVLITLVDGRRIYSTRA